MSPVCDTTLILPGTQGSSRVNRHGTKLLTNGKNESLVSLHWVLRKTQQCKRSSLGFDNLNRRGGFAQFSCRPSQRTGPAALPLRSLDDAVRRVLPRARAFYGA